MCKAATYGDVIYELWKAPVQVGSNGTRVDRGGHYTLVPITSSELVRNYYIALYTVGVSVKILFRDCENYRQICFDRTGRT
jgi:hypothetical protein